MRKLPAKNAKDYQIVIECDEIDWDESFPSTIIPDEKPTQTANDPIIAVNNTILQNKLDEISALISKPDVKDTADAPAVIVSNKNVRKTVQFTPPVPCMTPKPIEIPPLPQIQRAIKYRPRYPGVF